MVRITYSKEYKEYTGEEFPESLKTYFNTTGVKSVTVYGISNGCVWLSHGRNYHRYDNESVNNFESRNDMFADMSKVVEEIEEKS